MFILHTLLLWYEPHLFGQFAGRILKKKSHGRAAELLGIPKWDLIELYAGMGIPYLTQTREEVQEDIRTIERVMKAEEIRVCVEVLRSSGRYISESLLDSLLGQKR